MVWLIFQQKIRIQSNIFNYYINVLELSELRNTTIVFCMHQAAAVNYKIKLI